MTPKIRIISFFWHHLKRDSDIFNDTQNRPKTKQVACMKQNLYFLKWNESWWTTIISCRKQNHWSTTEEILQGRNRNPSRGRKYFLGNKKNQLKFNSYRLDFFLDYSGILKSGSLSRKLKHKIEASYHSSKNVSCYKCTDLSFSCENSTPRNRYATNEWILDIGCSPAVSSHLTRCKSFGVKRWQVQGLIQK